jgi:formate hydrogenlyase transcriptional activator
MILQDIGQRRAILTERMHAERALQRSESRYRTLFEKANDAVFLENEADEIIAVNQRACELLGYSRGELLRMRVPDLQAPEVRGTPGTVIKEELKRHQDTPFEGLDLHRDGRRIPVEITNTVIEEDGKRLVLSIVRDITERKRAQEAIHERLRFEKFLAELSARFVTLPSAAVDHGVVDGLRRLVAYVRVDRSTLFQFNADGSALERGHSYALPGCEPSSGPVASANFPWYARALSKKQPLALRRLPEDLPAEATSERAYCLQEGLKSQLLLPMQVGGQCFGALSLTCFRAYRDWPPELIEQLRPVAEVFANTLARAAADRRLQEALEEIKQLQGRLQAENTYLRGQMLHDPIHPKLIGHSDALGRVLACVKQVAPTDATVLLLGETGTGKELLAGVIHDLSPRRDRPMIKVNCAALPVTLMESELFGREKGAYTGAVSKQVGRFELADDSTIFLDEVGELPLETQAKLLRVMQEGSLERLGSPRTIQVQVRVIAASNRDLARMVADGRFRKDLYYRLNVFPIQIPPLRERREDIPALVWSFVEELARRMGKSVEAVSQRSLDALQRHAWPGNIRELRNAVERALITCQGSTLFIEPPTLSEPTVTCMTLEEVERAHILRVLEKTAWRVRGKNGAAAILGLPPTTLDSRMARLGIHRPGVPSEIP